MIPHDTIALRDAARDLGVEPARVARLARYLSLTPGEPVPRIEVERISRAGSGEEARYAALRSWLLKDVATRG